MRTILSIMVGLVALGALVSGFLMLMGPDGHLLGLRPGLLSESPFHDFRIPGALLFGIVGGISIWALLLILKNNPRRYTSSLICGLVLFIWILLQAIFIHKLNGLQTIIGGIGILITLLSYQLKGRWAV